MLYNYIINLFWFHRKLQKDYRDWYLELHETGHCWQGVNVIKLFPFLMGKFLLLPSNVILDWKVIACYKHCSLFCLIDSDKGKRFYNIDTRFAVTFSSIPWTKWSTMLWMRPSKSHSWLVSSRRSRICQLMHRIVLNAPGSTEGSAKKWRV